MGSFDLRLSVIDSEDRCNGCFQFSFPLYDQFLRIVRVRKKFTYCQDPLAYYMHVGAENGQPQARPYLSSGTMSMRKSDIICFMNRLEVLRKKMKAVGECYSFGKMVFVY